jgi:hypothetical protein
MPLPDVARAAGWRQPPLPLLLLLLVVEAVQQR